MKFPGTDLQLNEYNVNRGEGCTVNVAFTIHL